MWDANSFIRSKATATQSELRKLRLDVYADTVRSVLSGGYKTNEKNLITFDFTNCKSIFYDEHLTPCIPIYNKTTQIDIVPNDCLKESLRLKELGLNPVLLNMANRRIPGYGLIQGGTQEDALFRRTSLFLSLYQFYKDYHEDCLPFLEKNRCEIKQQQAQYPLSEDLGAIYSSGVYVFRDEESNGYIYLNVPKQISVLSTSGIYHPKLTDKNRLCISDESRLSEKIRTIFRIALLHNHDSIVLGALGCGSFANPPEHVAEIFHRIIEDDEFKNQFDKIVFAIVDDNNSCKEHNPDGNYLPFLKEFC